MSDLWYYSHDQQKTGPYSARRMKELAADGSILPTDVVWKEGVENGVAASKVKHLFAPAAPRPRHDAPVAAPTEPSAIMPAVQTDAPPTPVPEPVPPEVAAKATPLAPAPSDPPAAAGAWQQPARKGRAIAGRGAIIVG